ncbi:MAG: 2-phosphosulfolactate phosphatase [Balneolaceae bacterium]
MVNLEKLDVFFSLNSFNEAELRDKTSVVIDVLRASTSIVTALMNEAGAIIPVSDMGEASKIALNVNSENYLLCGEKDGIMIDGYDLGNSPLEYTKEVVKGKKLIFNTTNGTKAIKKTFGASNVCVASFLNVSAVVDFLKNQDKEIVLVCAGWKGRLAFEDIMLAGCIIHKLSGGKIPDKSRDGVRVAFTLYDTYRDDLVSAIKKTNHAERLKMLSGPDDIEYCCQIDITDILPYLNEGMITLKND